MRRFEYFAPQTLDEAIAVLQERRNGVKLLAGGTDLVVQMKEAGLHPPAVVSLHAVEALRGIAFDETRGLRIGAGASMAEVEAHPAVREHYAALSEGAGTVGSVQTRNMATIGGNVANAAPSADTVPPLIAFDAVAEIAGPSGTREVLVEELLTGPGQTALAPGEILVALRVPAPPARTGSVYRRHTPRKIMDIAAVGVGIRVSLAGDGTIDGARVCLGAVAPTPIRANDAEAALVGQQHSEGAFERAAALAQEAARPISDVRGSAEFRRYMVGVMAKRCLAIACERAGR
jgi:CO/xanthine dehydrogenase FAD-binding subunit